MLRYVQPFRNTFNHLSIFQLLYSMSTIFRAFLLFTKYFMYITYILFDHGYLLIYVCMLISAGTFFIVQNTDLNIQNYRFTHQIVRHGIWYLQVIEIDIYIHSSSVNQESKKNMQNYIQTNWKGALIIFVPL